MEEEIKFNIKKGYPNGENVFYHCMRCNVRIPSKSERYHECKCGNLGLDGLYGRLIVEDNDSLKILRII